MFTPDAVDARILQALVAEPRITVSELAERAGVVRNTAQARLERLQREGVLGANDRGVEIRALGYPVAAIVAVNLRHAEIEEAVAALGANPAVLLVEEVAGSTGDLLVRVAARSTDRPSIPTRFPSPRGSRRSKFGPRPRVGTRSSRSSF